MFSDMPRPNGGGSGEKLPSSLELIGYAHEYSSTTKSYTLQDDYQMIIGSTQSSTGYIFTHNEVASQVEPFNDGYPKSYGFAVFGNFKKGDTITYRCTQGGEYYIGLYGVK